MHNLRAAGEKSFESLVARLLMGVSGTRLRLCQAGTQGGVDALADIPFGVEAKRHKGEVSQRELLGGLANATLQYRDLELWVLAATSSIGAQAAEALRTFGDERGVATLVLDTSAPAQLPDVGEIVALAAADVGTTTEILFDPAWRTGGNPPDIGAIRAELLAIRERPGFATWIAKLAETLQQLPTWRQFVRNHNADLREKILKDARASFATPYDPAEAIRRDAEAQLSTWLEPSNRPSVAVVVGNRYDGKTWLVYRWLSENLHELTLPVFFFSSDDVKAANGQLDAILEAQVRRGMRQFSQHASAAIQRQKETAAESSRPWCVVVLDGANEYATDATPFLRSVASAVPLTPSEAKAALIVTCRRTDFEDSAFWLESRAHKRIELGSFNDREFEDALARNSLSSADVEKWPEDARKLMRHPRYLGLSLRFWRQLPMFVITADVLHFLDMSEKVVPRAAGAELRPEALQSVLIGLAEEWLKQRSLDLKTVRRHVRDVTDDVDASVQSITSRGVIGNQNGLFVLHAQQFEFGMGLLIRSSLLTADETSFTRKLEELLQPHRSDDEKVRWLRAAVAASGAAGDDLNRPEVLDFLLSEWISSRNFSNKDLEDLQNLIPLVFESMLRLLSSAAPIHKNILAVAEPMIRAGVDHNEPAVARALGKWCRIIPAGANWFIGDQGAAPPEVDLAPSEPSLQDLELRVADRPAGRSVRERQRFALLLACERPSLIRPVDALALVATRNAVGGYLDAAERLTLRRVLATTDASWYTAETASAAGQPDSARTTALRELIEITERDDLTALVDKLPKVEWGASWLARWTRENLSELRGSSDSKQLLQDAQRAGHLALDPDCPAPSKRWISRFARTAVARFVGSPHLHTGRTPSRDDLVLDEVEPALAAWAPKAGARIWRAFFSDIPRRIQAGDPAWSWVLSGHLPLLTPKLRRRLLRNIFHAIPKVHSLAHALERGYACVVVQSSASVRMHLLMNHPFNEEWQSLYEHLELGHDEALQVEAHAAVRTQRDRIRRNRSRGVLTYVGGMQLTAADIQLSATDLANDGILTELLSTSRLAPGTAAEALSPFAKVAHTLHDTALQYDAFRLSRKLGMHNLTAAGVVRALAAPQTARANGASASLSDEAAVAEGLQRLATSITEQLAKPNSDLGRSEQFLHNLAADVPREAFETWAQLLLASPVYAHLRHSGLLVPIVRHALATAHPAAQQLWALAYPFHRGRPTGTRFVENGLDWSLRLLHESDIDDDTARTLLRDLVRDSRSNAELTQIALAARKHPARLMSVVDELLLSTEEFDRARCRYILGWLSDTPDVRDRLSADDRSRYVRTIGEAAINRLDHERWAHHWIDRFLFARRAERRWAAGRLFVACSDAATSFWAPDIIWEATTASAIRRAEASLLLGSIRKTPDDSELRDSFLGYRVRDLELVMSPWRRPVQWDDLDVTSNEEDH